MRSEGEDGVVHTKNGGLQGLKREIRLGTNGDSNRRTLGQIENRRHPIQG